MRHVKFPRLRDAGAKRQSSRAPARSGGGMADTTVLEAVAVRRAGSSPVPSTKSNFVSRARMKRFSSGDVQASSDGARLLQAHGSSRVQEYCSRLKSGTALMNCFVGRALAGSGIVGIVLAEARRRAPALLETALSRGQAQRRAAPGCSNNFHDAPRPHSCRRRRSPTSVGPFARETLSRPRTSATFSDVRPRRWPRFLWRDSA